MTQSGQGEEPSARPAREGIVLPSDGGEPLLPGMTGGRGGQQVPPSVPATPPPTPPASAPPGGQSWGTPWGPGRHDDQQYDQTPPPGQGQSWGTPPAPAWGAPEQHQQPSPSPWPAAPEQPGTPQSQPLPPEGASGGSYGGPIPGTSPSPSYGEHHGTSYGDHQGASYGDHGTPAPSPAPGPQQPYPTQGGPSSAPLPPAGADAYGAPGPTAGHGGAGPMPPAQGGQYGSYGPGAPQPPAGQGTPDAPLPHAGSGGFGAPLPPADEGATQYIPPVAPGSAPAADEGATQYIPPVAASADEGATQYLPPVGPGALPPEAGAGAPADSTQKLGRVRPGSRPGPGPMPGASGPDAEATQYIAPVTDQPGRQPLADFDNLFRSEPGGESPAAATQQLPRFQQPQAHHAPEPGHFPPAAYDDGGREGHGGRTRSRLPLIIGVGVGIVVLGVGAGALLAGGGDDKDDNKTVAATAPATEGSSASPSADPAKQQATDLDKLLASSGDSRTAVIRAVADVKGCDNLAQAAQNLRDAARQRTQLVTDLSKLGVDKLPNHAALTTALTKAWQASASADNHYAAWADQVAGDKKLCKKGQARATGQAQAGNRASGTASAQKKTAAQLWNTIARQYGLTPRQPTQL